MSVVERALVGSVRRHRGRVLAAGALLLFVRPVDAGAQDLDSLSVDEYGQQYDVGAGEAARRLDLQARAAGITGALERRLGEDYAGVWFDNAEGRFVVPVLSKSDAAVAAAEFDGRGLGAGEFRTTLVDSSLAELEAAQERMTASISGPLSKGRARSGIDTSVNSVVVEFASDAPAEGKAAIRAAATSDPAPVRIVETSPDSFDEEAAACVWGEWRVCDPPFHGGVEIDRWTSPKEVEVCTAGFAMTGNQFANKFVLSAGHCLEHSGPWVSHTANFYENELGNTEAFYFAGGNADAGLIRVKDTNWWVQNWAWRGHIVVWGAPPRPWEVAYSSWPIAGSQSSFVGEFVCHNGSTTGSSCGDVQQLNVKTTYEGSKSLNHMTKVSGICGNKGDSGGPVWGQGNWAVGIWSGGENGSCGNHYYSEVREAEQIFGVHVTPW
jgi:hypothetical protein